MIDSLQNWAETNDTLLWWLVATTLAMLIFTPLAVGWMLVRLPKDYFTQEQHLPLESWREMPAVRYSLLVVKNFFGVVIIVAGLVMLLVPGQGLLTITMGLILTDFPGKFRLQRWIVTKPSVWRSINWLRRRAKREPLSRPK